MAVTGGLLCVTTLKPGKYFTRAQYLAELSQLCDRYHQASQSNELCELTVQRHSLLDLFNWYKKADKPIPPASLSERVNKLPAAHKHALAHALCVSSGTQHRLLQNLLRAFSAFQVWLEHDGLVDDATLVMNILDAKRSRTRLGAVAACELRFLLRKYGSDLLRSPPSCKWDELFETVGVAHAVDLLFKVMPHAIPCGTHDPSVVWGLRESGHNIDATVISLHDDCVSVLQSSGLFCLPKPDAAPEIHKRIAL